MSKLLTQVTSWWHQGTATAIDVERIDSRKICMKKQSSNGYK
jgi:hypothetical protein